MESIFVWIQMSWSRIREWTNQLIHAARELRPEAPSGHVKPERVKSPEWRKKALRWVGISAGALVGLFILIVILDLIFAGGEASREPATNAYGFQTSGTDFTSSIPNPMRGMTIAATIVGALIGSGFVLLGVFWRFMIERYGWAIFIGIAVFAILIGETSSNPAMTGMASMFGFIAGVIGGASLAMKFFATITPETQLPNPFGSSRWAKREDLEQWGLLGELDKGDGLFLGEEMDDGTPLIYRGDMHALTVAPTRTGKGATAIIPNLLRSTGSILVIDPKGENARRTAVKRAEMGQRIHIVDPWGISMEADRYGPGVSADRIARFNPLNALDPDDPDLASDAMLLADALVVETDKDPFWSNEAKALIYGFILYVVTEPEEEGQRTLGRVRDILSLPPAPDMEEASLPGTMDEILLRMAGSKNRLVSAAAFRLSQKEAKERAGVISTAQSNTHFLDSPKIRESLSGSDFRFSDLKTGETPATIYLVLPLDRLPTFNRWLRLLITSALIDLTRIPAREDSEPVRVILDEFAALEKLKLVETAFGTMAGLGVQLWAVTQDLSQLMRLYGDKGWQTFVSNAGVLQYFGSRDYETAKYAEHLTGMTTMRKRSISFSTSVSTGYQSGGKSTSETTSYDDVQRPLAYADEMMTLHRDLQVLFVENRYPITARKRWWFRHNDEPAASLVKTD